MLYDCCTQIRESTFSTTPARGEKSAINSLPWFVCLLYAGLITEPTTIEKEATIVAKIKPLNSPTALPFFFCILFLFFILQV